MLCFLSLLSCPRYSLAHKNDLIHQTKKPPSKEAAHRSEQNLCRGACFPERETRERLIRSLPRERHDPRRLAGGGGLRGWVPAYARAWADSSFVPAATVPRLRLRFIPVSPGTKKWIFRASTYTVAVLSICSPCAASTRPKSWSCSLVLM